MTSKLRVSRRKWIELGITASLTVTFLILPICAGTGTYPLAIVQGNSMFPNLQNGDLVFFTKPPSIIANGTIIVFVQGGSGVSALDSLIRPVVIHRVVGTVVQVDGSVYYRTKGDNNQLDDNGFVQSNHILGVETIVIPRVGMLVLFFESPFGLVLLIGLITLFYVGKVDLYMNDEKKKENLLSALASMVQRGELPMEKFSKIEVAVKHSGSAQIDGFSGGSVPKLLDYIKKGSLKDKWTANKTKCPRCSQDAIALRGEKERTFLLCPYCADASTENQDYLLKSPKASGTEINIISVEKGKPANQEKSIRTSKPETKAHGGIKGQTQVKDDKNEKSKKVSFYLFGENEFEGCSHRFKYLKSLRKNEPILDECFGCPRIIDCLKAEENKLETGAH